MHTRIGSSCDYVLLCEIAYSEGAIVGSPFIFRTDELGTVRKPVLRVPNGWKPGSYHVRFTSLPGFRDDFTFNFDSRSGTTLNDGSASNYISVRSWFVSVRHERPMASHDIPWYGPEIGHRRDCNFSSFWFFFLITLVVFFERMSCWFMCQTQIWKIHHFSTVRFLTNPHILVVNFAQADARAGTRTQRPSLKEMWHDWRCASRKGIWKITSFFWVFWVPWKVKSDDRPAVNLSFNVVGGVPF